MNEKFIRSANPTYYGICLKHLAMARRAAVINNMGEHFISDLDHLSATVKYKQAAEVQEKGAEA